MSQQILSQGDPFELRCHGSFPLDWSIPDTARSANIKTKRCLTCPMDQTYQSVLNIDVMSFHQTGTYACFYSRHADRQDNSTRAEAYIYVTTNGKLVLPGITMALYVSTYANSYAWSKKGTTIWGQDPWGGGFFCTVLSPHNKSDLMAFVCLPSHLPQSVSRSKTLMWSVLTCSLVEKEIYGKNHSNILMYVFSEHDLIIPSGFILSIGNGMKNIYLYIITI